MCLLSGVRPNKRFSTGSTSGFTLEVLDELVPVAKLVKLDTRSTVLDTVSAALLMATLFCRVHKTSLVLAPRFCLIDRASFLCF